MAKSYAPTSLNPEPLYRSLHNAEIRLLVLRSPDEFDLHVSSLNDGPEYKAVSYWWGCATATEVVKINGHDIRLPKHVTSMLRTLFIEHKAVCLWIDTICINQNDAKEKSSQVSMMSSIYSSASRVFAWIGEVDDATDLVFDVLLEYDRRRGAQRRPYQDLDEAQQLAYTRKVFCDSYISRAGSFPAPSEEDDDLLHDEFNWLRPLYSREYWKRSWIVQEAILAKELFICCGVKAIEFEHVYGLSLDWGSFEQGFGTGNHRRLQSISTGWATIQAICGHRRRRAQALVQGNVQLRPEEHATLQEIIRVYVLEYRCKEAKDKVYAFRALNEQWKNIIVDYGKSELEVFLDAVRPAHFWTGPGSITLAASLFFAMHLGSINDFAQLVPLIFGVDRAASLELQELVVSDGFHARPFPDKHRGHLQDTFS